MKTKGLLLLAIVFLFFGMVGFVQATTIEVLYGDQDGFGIGLTEGMYNYWPIPVASGDEGVTDNWMYGTQSWDLTYDISGLGTIQSASLEIFTLGQGYYGTSSLYVDGLYVGELTDGDDMDLGIGEANEAIIDIFDLLTFASYLDGANTIQVVTSMGTGDGWALDYSLLSISDDVAPVPEPGTIVLMGLGLVGLAGMGRKKLFKK